MKIGILGAGHIAEKMAKTLLELSKTGLPEYSDLSYAVASRDLAKAQAFASTWGIKKAFGSYEQMCSDPQVELVYVATPHSFHHAHVRLALENGKHVLCEKCFMMNEAEAADVCSLAEEKGLLLAEAAWPCYQPFFKQIRDLVDSGIIGRPNSLIASLGYPVIDVERIIRPELGGGALMDIGVYTIFFAHKCFGLDYEVGSTEATFAPTGIDKHSFTTLRYQDGRLAMLHSSALDCSSHMGIINGTEGVMEVDNINNPKYVDVYDRPHNLVKEFKAEPQITGFEFQVMECIDSARKGLTECPSFTHADSLAVLRLKDELFRRWGR